MIELAKDTMFLDVKGIPVTLGAGHAATPGMYCAAWDEAQPRPFDADTARRDGAAITREKFLDLVCMLSMERLRKEGERAA